MTPKYDIAIIGNGPAGLSAAISATEKNKKAIIFGTKDEFIKSLNEIDIDIKQEKINSIYSIEGYFTLVGNHNIYEASSIILATGINFDKLIKGEDIFLGKGVGYCISCDAHLFKDKVVTIISYNKNEENKVNFISKIASKVYYVPMYNEDVDTDLSVEIIKDIPQEIVGDKLVNKLVLKNKEIKTDGIFILRDAISPSQLIPGLSIDKNNVVVDEFMKTNIDGCFAAGDIVGEPYEYIKAIKEGNIAAFSAISYLEKQKHKCSVM